MMTVTVCRKMDCFLVLKLNMQHKFAGNGGVIESLKQVKLQRNEFDAFGFFLVVIG